MSRLNYLAAAFFLAQTIGSFSILDRVVYGEWDYKTTDKLNQSLNLMVILAGFTLFWTGFRSVRRIEKGGWLVIALAVFLSLSALWSIDPLTSARRGILYLLWATGAIGLANSFKGDEFLRIFGYVCLLAALVSVGLLAVSPSTVLMGDGALRGVFTHKSVMGQAMATGALLSLYRIRVDDGSKVPGIMMLLLFIGVTVAAHSMTSLLAIAAFCGAESVIALIRRRGVARLAGIGLVVVLVPGLLIGSVFPDQILEMLGKDPSLTGRSDLWGYVVQAIAQRPILGWGLMAFWTSNNPIAVGISTTLGWIVPQAHNGLLEMLLDIGVVGTMFFAGLMTRNIIIAIRCLNTAAREMAITLMMSCAGILLVGVTESVLIDPAEPAANILFVTGFVCERTLRLTRKQVLARRVPMRTAA
jgi:O-antigen ligase